MNILLYSLNFSPEKTGIGKYNAEFVDSLLNKGFDVSVVCAPPYYPEWKVKNGYSASKFVQETSGSLSVHRCPLYVPKNVTTVKRLLHLLSFSVTSAFKLLTLFRKSHDVLIVVQPTFFCVPISLLFCKLTRTRSILHIQDFELNAMLGLGMAKPGFLTKLLYRIESFFMKKFDAVSTISFSMLDKASEKGVNDSQLLFFPNWADTEFVNPSVDGTCFKVRLGIPLSTKVVLYAGNIGKKQGLDLVLNAATFFLDQDVVFLFVGDGAYANDLKRLSNEMGLKNCIFLPLQDWEDVPSMLSMADIHLVIQRRGAADSVLPSKVTNILSCGGNAIVTADGDTELGLLEKRFPGIYKLIEPENLEKLVEALKQQLSTTDVSYNRIARNYSVSYLNKEKIIDDFMSSVIKMCDS